VNKGFFLTQSLVLSLLQMAVAQAAPAENLDKIREHAQEAGRRGSRLLCLPEMFSTGFNWAKNRGLVKDWRGPVDAMGVIAKENRLWIAGSILTGDEQGRMRNSLMVWDDSGREAAVYHKAHLFSLFNEQKHVTAGDRIEVADTPWGPTGLSVCYDLRFPELFRACALRGAVMQLLPAGWPHPRLEHWLVLTRARAIENQLFFVAVNQCGHEEITPGNSVKYCGHSAVIDPWGNAVSEAAGEDEVLLTAQIDFAEVDAVRSRLTALKDRRPGVY
jgi:omega-amidase